ncbi:MAG TPA: hypothetical protein VM580_22595 [Labilithrix sp.]|nr:hypothetical protein [Labilithrix sp.]
MHFRASTGAPWCLLRGLRASGLRGIARVLHGYGFDREQAAASTQIRQPLLAVDFEQRCPGVLAYFKTE